MLLIQFDDTEITGMERLYETFGDVMLDLAEDTLTENLEWLKMQLPDDPRAPMEPGYPSPIHSDKQRKWWWANVKEGNIPGWRWNNGTLEKVPKGERNWNFRDSFEVQVHRAPGEVYGELGTNLPYAPWVIGPDYPGRLFDTPQGQRQMYQSRIHAYRDRWWQLDSAMNWERVGAFSHNVQEFFWLEIQEWIQRELDDPNTVWKRR